MFAYQRIQRAMDRAAMSQGKLARATGMSQPTISRILAGDRAPKVAELDAISKALSCPLSYFLMSAGLPDRTQLAARSSDSAAMDELIDSVSSCVAMDRYLTELGF